MKHASVRLALPSAGASDLRLTIRWHSLAWRGKLDPDAEVRVLLDGREVGTLTARPDWETATLDLPPQEVKSGYVVIELLTPTARPPTAETRLLGVAVDSIQIGYR